MTGCEIWGTPMERAFIEHPQLEASFLWGGYPVKEMTSKFFQAKPSKVTKLLNAPSDLEDQRFSVIDLPGHFFNMIGVRSFDKVLYLADCMFGDNILKKYRIPFVYDVASYKDTLHKVAGINADYYVMSHGEVQTDIGPAIRQNLAAVEEIEEKILALVSVPQTFDAVLQQVADSFMLTLDYGQFALVGSTIRSFLSYLYNNSKICYTFDGNRMYWSRISS